jgi:energy-coupling factor transporter ATP-binding protein EcfA2
MSPAAKESFKGEPTERQKLALDVAINTPDIALIVGPPGTGKTQVIAALKILLAGALENQSLQHQILISSYQHDAVDNALNRGRVFGLPSVRIGGRNLGVDPIAAWCEDTRKALAKRLDSIQSNEPLTQPLAELNQRLTTLRLGSFSLLERNTQFEQVGVLLQKLNALNMFNA